MSLSPDRLPAKTVLPDDSKDLDGKSTAPDGMDGASLELVAEHTASPEHTAAFDRLNELEQALLSHAQQLEASRQTAHGAVERMKHWAAGMAEREAQLRADRELVDNLKNQLAAVDLQQLHAEVLPQLTLLEDRIGREYHLASSEANQAKAPGADKIHSEPLPDLPATAQQRLETMRQSITQHQAVLQSERGSWRDTFDRARRWLTKVDSVEVTLSKLNIEIDHLLDQIQHASADQVTQHLWTQVNELEQRCVQLVKVETELSNVPESKAEVEAKFPIEMSGAIKTSWLPNEIVEGKLGMLGKYGQDCMRSNPELGIGVVADGSSTGKDSYEVARRASRRAQDIMEDLPIELCDSLEEVEFFLQDEVNKLLDEIRAMPNEMTGATTLLAARYLEKFDAVVMIDIGDCEIVAVAGKQVQELKPPLEHTNRTDAISKSYRTLRKDGKPITHIDLILELNDWDHKPLKPEDFFTETTTRFKHETDRPFVRTVSLEKLRQLQPGLPIEILLASDGFQNDTGKTLAQAAPEIIELGVQGIVDQITDDTLLEVSETGDVKRLYEEKDDVTLLRMKLPALEQAVV